MDKCVILAGARIEDYKLISLPEDCYVICADGGYHHAEKLGVKPDVLLGDFDTLESLDGVNCEIQRFKPEKDDTDTMLAVKLAFERGFKEIYLCGVLGGRIDHTIANIFILEYILNHGGVGYILNGSDEIMLMKAGNMTISRKQGFYFSLISVSNTCQVQSLDGVKYPIRNTTLTRDFPLGISNEIINDCCHISIKNGLLLIIFSKDTNQF